jgi:hypothetical protein
MLALKVMGFLPERMDDTALEMAPAQPSPAAA